MHKGRRKSYALAAMTALILSTLLFAVGCSKTKRPVGGRDAQPGSTGTSMTSKVEANTTVMVSGGVLTVDGKSAGSTVGIADLGKARVIDGLLDVLKRKHTAFKQRYPGKPFPGRLSIEVREGLSMLEFKSVFQTSASAGYPHIFIAADGGVVAVEAIVPGPPTTTEDAVPPKELHVYLLESEVRLEGRQGGTITSEATVAAITERADSRAALTKAVVDHFRTGTMSSAGHPDVVVSAENSMSFAAFNNGLLAARAAHGQIVAANPGTANPFDLVFTMAPGRSRHQAPDNCLSTDPTDPLCRRHDMWGDGSADAGRMPRVRMGNIAVTGRLPREVIYRIVRQSFGRLRACYDAGLKTNPELQGRVALRFVIGADGGISQVKGGGDLPDKDVVNCVTRSLDGVNFPRPESGTVEVSLPVVFTPGS